VKVKLDENVHGDVAGVLTSVGHDVTTAYKQGLAGRPDKDIADAVRAEGRCLITSDLDFSDPRKFSPSQFAGIVVLRLHVPTSRLQVESITRFLAAKPQLMGKLWIVEETRARDWTP